jgi:hypothetical protein
MFDTSEIEASIKEGERDYEENDTVDLFIVNLENQKKADNLPPLKRKTMSCF